MIFSLAVSQKQHGVGRRLALMRSQSEAVGLARLSGHRGERSRGGALWSFARNSGAAGGLTAWHCYTSTNAQKKKTEVAVIWETTVNIGRYSIS